jgi:hypothetical protein
VAGAALDSAGHGAWAAQVATVLPPATARQPQVIQRACLLLGSQWQTAEAGSAEAEEPWLPMEEDGDLIEVDEIAAGGRPEMSREEKDTAEKKSCGTKFLSF